MPTLNWLTRKDDIKASGRILESVEKGVYGKPDVHKIVISDT